MTANPAISFVTLGVTDLGRSRRFYRAVGYVEHPRSNEHVVFMDLDGQVLALFPRQALAEDAGGPPAPPGVGISMALARNVAAESEVASLIETAVTAGGRVLRSPSSPPWGGVRGYFADPDGFAWEVAWNPAMELDDRGRVRFPSAD